MFITKFQNRLECCNAYVIIKEVCQKVGIQEKIGTHTQRKTFGYQEDEIIESYKNFVL